MNAYLPLKWLGIDKANLTTYKRQYCEFGGFGGHEIIGYRNLEVLKEEIESNSLRRTKEILKDSLPSKTIIKELVTLSDEHRKFYLDVKKGIKEATINIAGKEVKVAAASSLGNARILAEELRADLAAGREPKYQMIEIMACPGGCVDGGGQPFHHGDFEKVKARGAALYAIDSNKTQRKSHKNEDILTLYANFLGKRGGHEAHEYLHTDFTDKSNPYMNE